MLGGVYLLFIIILENFSVVNNIERFLINKSCRDNWGFGMDIDDFIMLLYVWR